MVKKVFIDTNVWLRFFLKDQQEQFNWSSELIKLAEEGKIKPYTSAIVLLEIHYVLSKIYQLTSSQVNKVIKGILATRNLVVINKTDFKKAFVWHQKYKVKLSDCLIASSLPANYLFASWDKELKRPKLFPVNSPKETVKNMN